MLLLKPLLPLAPLHRKSLYSRSFQKASLAYLAMKKQTKRNLSQALASRLTTAMLAARKTIRAKHPAIVATNALSALNATRRPTIAMTSPVNVIRVSLAKTVTVTKVVKSLKREIPAAEILSAITISVKISAITNVKIRNLKHKQAIQMMTIKKKHLADHAITVSVAAIAQNAIAILTNL